MAGLAYAMINSLSLNDVRLFTGAGDITMVAEGAVVVKKASGAATQVTLPANPAANLGGTFRWVIDGNGDAATNNITVVASTGNIIGAASYVISENYGAVLFFYPNGGTEWLVAGTFNDVAAAEIAFLNGVTAGTAAASKALVLGATKNIDTFRMTGKLFTPQAAPETSADTATLTDAQMLSGILVATPTAAAAYTMRTGTQLKAALPATLTAGDCFDLTIINIGGTGDDITLTASTDITIVGDAVVRPSADSGTEQAGQGTFRLRYTTGVTFIAYRVG